MTFGQTKIKAEPCGLSHTHANSPYDCLADEETGCISNRSCKSEETASVWSIYLNANNSTSGPVEAERSLHNRPSILAMWLSHQTRCIISLHTRMHQHSRLKPLYLRWFRSFIASLCICINTACFTVRVAIRKSLCEAFFSLRRSARVCSFSL